MTPRERILAVLDRRPVDRLPVDLWHAPEVAAALRRRFAVGDDVSMWKALGLDKIAWDFLDYQAEDGDRASTLSGAGAEWRGRRNVWGVPLRTVQAGAARYEEFGDPPLAGCTASSLDDYARWPKVDRFDYDSAAAFVQSRFCPAGHDAKRAHPRRPRSAARRSVAGRSLARA